MRTLKNKVIDYNEMMKELGVISLKTILVTGGTDGVGKGLVLHYLKNDYKVIAVGTSAAKAGQLRADATAMEKENNLQFIQANLSLVSENRKLVAMIKERYNALDGLIMCAASLKPQEKYTETSEGFEFTFALYYLSRYVLSNELKDLLNLAENPFILNVAAPGMKGQINWDDIQFTNNYKGQSVQFHGSRLNDLLGVSFTERDMTKKIKYMLFNPMAVRTDGAAKMFEGKSLMQRISRLYYKFFGKSVDEIVEMIIQNMDVTKATGLVAYKQLTLVPLNMSTFDKVSAKKLSVLTQELLK